MTRKKRERGPNSPTRQQRIEQAADTYSRQLVIYHESNRMLNEKLWVQKVMRKHKSTCTASYDTSRRDLAIMARRVQLNTVKLAEAHATLLHILSPGSRPPGYEHFHCQPELSDEITEDYEDD